LSRLKDCKLLIIPSWDQICEFVILLLFIFDRILKLYLYAVLDQLRVLVFFFSSIMSQTMEETIEAACKARDIAGCVLFAEDISG
jgi:hypothetical protein